MASYNKRIGFTLVEMLVVVAIIGVIVGLLLPAINMARESARQTQCINNQQELGKAIINYETSKQRLPGVVNFVNPSDPINSLKTNWIITLFTDLGRKDLWNTWQGGVVNLNNPQPVQVDQLICPSNKQIALPGGLSYVVNMGVYNVPDTPFLPGHNAPDINSMGRRRLFRNRASTPIQESDCSLVSLTTAGRTVMLSERLDAGPWNFIPAAVGADTFNTSQYDNTEFKRLAFPWPNQFFDFPGTNILSTRTIGTKYFGDPANSGNPPLPPLLSSNHPNVIIVTFFDGHTETLSADTKCWKSPADPNDMPSMNGTP
jgi:prepilin-type N-terminal cleavage/methylation domain-containing protein